MKMECRVEFELSSVRRVVVISVSWKAVIVHD